MITLNDYLYTGDTVLKILLRYSSDLKDEAIKTHNSIDLVHSNFLIQIIELLEHTDFLTSQSQRIKELLLSIFLISLRQITDIPKRTR